MPSVGMRRTTRVFGVVKGVDGARVLRSGRRLWPDAGDGKQRRSNYGDDWYHPVIKKNGGNGPGGPKCKLNGWANVVKVKFKSEEEKDLEELQVYENEKEVNLCKKVKEVKEEMKGVDRMFGIVYSRKRKRNGDRKIELLEDKMYGIQFSRRQKRKKSEKMVPFSVFGMGLESCCSVRSSGFFACLLASVLGYIKRARPRVELRELASFMLSQQISDVFASYGIRFLWDPPIDSTAMCKIFGAVRFIPLFSLDFSAVPSCFMYIHCSMLFRLKCLPSLPVNNSVSVTEDYSSGEDVEYVFEPKPKVPVVDITVNRVALHPSVRSSKLAARNVQYRNSLNARSIQKRRSSLRRRRARNPSLIGAQRAGGSVVSELTSSRKSGIALSSASSKIKLRSSIRSNSAVSIKEATSSMDQLMRDSDLSCCCASILIVESDRCCRVEGADVTLEMSDSKEWHLVVKKDGQPRYTHKAQKIMRPSSCNRFTHAIIWSGDDNWKLEFPNRQDWLNFKDLYKECSERNAQVSVAKVIPIPGVLEVSGYQDSNSVPFYLPDSYISVNVDELSRALAKRTANYDMDSEDEEWLQKFNNEFFTENELHEHISEDNFELMVDAFEKAYFCSPDDFSNEEAAVNLCLDMGRREVVLAVYNYWMKKRKQKRSALLRVFQGRQAKKPPLIPKPALRKRRSFKRQASQSGRGKPPVLLPVVTQQDALEEQNAMLRVEEAKASAKRSLEAAVLKRQRAQLLMQNADLATYKATMAMRIAEAAQVGESADAAADHFLD
ncbi:Enhancer of polycomb-like protein [Melia azedarach]|uniref:Enhancer of polycomb-like protein n=1 Tax=Melia azedarach TaxID=155640 RepID=A0ACC1YBD8_MELAZ|nr:Enhancer of polycomb-like protein [Melia azedarach]